MLNYPAVPWVSSGKNPSRRLAARAAEFPPAHQKPASGRGVPDID